MQQSAECISHKPACAGRTCPPSARRLSHMVRCLFCLYVVRCALAGGARSHRAPRLPSALHVWAVVSSAVPGADVGALALSRCRYGPGWHQHDVLPLVALFLGPAIDGQQPENNPKNKPTYNRMQRTPCNVSCTPCRMKHAAHGMHHAAYDITHRVTARDTHSGKQSHRRARHHGGYCTGAVVRGANELIARSESEHQRRGRSLGFRYFLLS